MCCSRSNIKQSNASKSFRQQQSCSRLQQDNLVHFRQGVRLMMSAEHRSSCPRYWVFDELTKYAWRIRRCRNRAMTDPREGDGGIGMSRHCMLRGHTKCNRRTAIRVGRVARLQAVDNKALQSAGMYCLPLTRHALSARFSPYGLPRSYLPKN